MRSVIVPLTGRARTFFEEKYGILSVPAAYPFATTLAEEEDHGMEPLPLKRGVDFLEYGLLEEE